MSEAPGIRKTDSKDLIGQRPKAQSATGFRPFRFHVYGRESRSSQGRDAPLRSGCIVQRFLRSRLFPLSPKAERVRRTAPRRETGAEAAGWSQSCARRNSPLFPKRKPKARGELSKAGFFAFTSRKWRGGFKRGRRGGGRLFKVLHILNGAEEADAVSFPNRPDFESIPSEL